MNEYVRKCAAPDCDEMFATDRANQRYCTSDCRDRTNSRKRGRHDKPKKEEPLRPMSNKALNAYFRLARPAKP